MSIQSKKRRLTHCEMAPRGDGRVQKKRSVQTTSRGLTLTEILMVLAVTGTLSTVLIPVGARARENVRSALCVANLRDMHDGVVRYANDNQGRLPIAGLAPAHFVDGTRTGAWPLQILPYIYPEATVQEAFRQGRPADTPSLFHCPSSNRPLGHTTHYGANVRVMPLTLSKRRCMTHFESSVVLIADVHPSRELIFDPENNATLYGSTRDNSSGGGLAGRHQGRKNILFLGGHVDSVRQGDLPSATKAPAQAESLWGSVAEEWKYAGSEK